MNSDESTVNNKKGCRCASLCLQFLPLLTVAVLICAWRPILISYSLTFLKMVASDIVNDKQGFLDNEQQFRIKEWRFYRIESRYGQMWCKTRLPSRSNVTWLTIMTSDDYIVPTLVLGHSIRTFSCQKNMIVLISDDVSVEARNALRSVGWKTRLVEEMDCNWIDYKVGGDRNRGFLGRPLGNRIRGTHSRFYAWKYTEFSKIIYVDADYMLMTNIDELFDIPEDFAAVPCSRPGVMDPCFNAGLLVLKPSSQCYREIMELWRGTTLKDTCPTDQELLNEYFVGNWKALPFAYNVRRVIFRPMNAFHFASGRVLPKPWTAECRPSRKEASEFDGPILVLDDMLIIFWKIFYQLLETYSLEEWFRSTKFFRPEQEFGHQLYYADCAKKDQPKFYTVNLNEIVKQLNQTKLRLMDRFSSTVYGVPSINQSINPSTSRSKGQ